MHTRVDQQRADRFSLYMLYDDEVSFYTGLYVFLIVGYVALIFVLPGDV